MTATETTTGTAPSRATLPNTELSKPARPHQPLWWSEFWLIALTAITIVITRRLFQSWDYLFAMALLGIGTHVLIRETRRQNWPLPLAALASAVLGGLLCTKLLYDYTLYAQFFPTGFTFSQLGADLSNAWSEFGFVVAPTEATNGFVLAAAIGAWAIAVSSDSLAFRHKSAFSACIPAFILMMFIGALATDGWAVLSAAIAVFCALLFAVTHRLAHRKVSWLRGGSPVRRQARSPVRLSLGLAAAAAIGAAVLTPLLPGADGNALIALKDLDGESRPARVALNPLVDARGRLVSTSNAELFRVEADAPAYWRVSGLGTFDGSVWGSDRSYSDASGQLREIGQDEPVLSQVVTIEALDSIWLPAAYEPVVFEGEDVLYDPETATLVLRGGIELETGRSYTVTSSLTVPTVEQLNAAGDTVPEEIGGYYTDLPADFSPEIVALAEEITAEAGTPFARALALQNFFLDNFTYSLSATSGHGTDRLQTFLFDDRRGYCEQFSGSYAAMARAIGLPARVAVGFTPGELVDGVYVVRGEHYHAWPEVWIGDRWVYFEPTPGRGAPRTTAYTGVSVQQAAPGDPNSVLLAEDTGEVVPNNDLLGDLSIEGGVSGLTGVLEDFSGEDAGVLNSFDGTVLVVVVLVALAVLVAAGLTWLIAVPTLAWLRRERRRRRAQGDYRAEVQCSWQDLCEALDAAGTQRSIGESHTEFATRAAETNGLDFAATQKVASAMDYACFAQNEPAASEVDMQDSRVRDLKHTLREQSSPWTRVRRTYLNRSRQQIQ